MFADGCATHAGMTMYGNSGRSSAKHTSFFIRRLPSLPTRFARCARLTNLLKNLTGPINRRESDQLIANRVRANAPIRTSYGAVTRLGKASDTVAQNTGFHSNDMMNFIPLKMENALFAEKRRRIRSQKAGKFAAWLSIILTTLAKAEACCVSVAIQHSINSKNMVGSGRITPSHT